MDAPEEAPFQPEAVHAVTAQQEEIIRLRNKHTADLAEAWDRNVYLSACIKQMQLEAHTEIGRLNAEISMLRTELTEARGDEPAQERAEPPEG